MSMEPVLRVEWRREANIASCTGITIAWNLISWGSILMINGDKMRVNGTSFHSYVDAFSQHPVTAGVLLFPLIGLVMIYHCLALWINRTEMKIERGDFVVSRGPLYWTYSDVRVPIKDIRQAYVQEYSPFAEGEEKVLRYRLMIQRVSGGETVLESDIEQLDQAQSLEIWLEENLQIINVKVKGEAEIDTDILKSS